MTKKRLFFRIAFGSGKLLVWWCILFAACTTDYPSVNKMQEDDFLRLDFALTGTRAEMNEDGSGHFEENDKIGLYVINNGRIAYRELTYHGNEWLPRLRRSEFGEGELTLSAHYPALSSAEAFSPVSYPYSCADIQTEEEYRQKDLLHAASSILPGENRASLVFRHLFHRLEINLKGESEAVRIKVRTQPDGVIDLLTGKAIVSRENESQWVTPVEKSEGRYWTLIYPQEAAPYQGEEGWVKITGAGQETLVKAPERLNGGEKLVYFEPGKQVQINLNLKPGEESLANKVLWVYGVHAPAFPGKEHVPSLPPALDRYPVGKWFRYNWSFMESQNLTWEEGCGWFDCNKSRDYDEGDENLCWAASASNLIIWWMRHNQPYIEAYDKEYGSGVILPATSGKVERPSSEFKPLYDIDGSVNRAPVFEFFKDLFPDRGSWNRSGMNWFLTGNTKDLQTSPSITGFPGFFHHVFGRNDEIAIDSKRYLNREDFNDFMKDALLNKKAIGINVTNMGGPGNHAMTVWGAEFDADGVISHIYYCDNNLSGQDANGAMITRAEIVYIEDNSIPEAGTRIYTYLKSINGEDGSVGSKFRILSLCSADLRRDIWEKKYPHIRVNE